MSDAFEEYHYVLDEQGNKKVVFMSWDSHWEPTMGKLMKGAMIRLEIHDADPDAKFEKSPLNTGETWKKHNDPETREEARREWAERAFL